MRIKIRRSALRHGITEERMRYVVSHCAEPIYPPSQDPDRADLVLFLGPDRYGNALEVLGLELPDGGIRLIHAMELRAKYTDAYERVTGWQRKRR